MPNEGLSGKLDSEKLEKLDLLIFSYETNSTVPIRWEELDPSENYRLSIRKKDISLIYRSLTLDKVREYLEDTHKRLGLEGASICLIPQGGR